MRLEWLFLMQIVMGILMIVFLQKLIQIKKQMDKIVKEVSNYITYITDEMEVSDDFIEEKPTEKKGEDEAKNRLIQAVLKEYFP